MKLIAHMYNTTTEAADPKRFYMRVPIPLKRKIAEIVFLKWTPSGCFDPKLPLHAASP